MKRFILLSFSIFVFGLHQPANADTLDCKASYSQKAPAQTKIGFAKGMAIQGWKTAVSNAFGSQYGKWNPEEWGHTVTCTTFRPKVSDGRGVKRYQCTATGKPCAVIKD